MDNDAVKENRPQYRCGVSIIRKKKCKKRNEDKEEEKCFVSCRKKRRININHYYSCSTLITKGVERIWHSVAILAVHKI